VNIDVRYDSWDGGGGVPATQSVENSVANVSFVLPLLTPSDVAPTWIGDEWKQTIYDEALAKDIDVLPVLGVGKLNAVPDFLHKISFADLCNQDYNREFRRLVETIRNRSGNGSITLPNVGSDTDNTRSPLTLPANPLVLEVSEDLLSFFANDRRVTPFLEEHIPMMREGLFYELGVQFPKLSLRVWPDASSSSIRIVINDIPEKVIEFYPDLVMVNERASTMQALGFAAKPAVNPANDASCSWIPAYEVSAALKYDLTTWDAHEFLVLTLSAILRRRAANFISVKEAQAMLQQIEPVFPLLVTETIPKTVSLFVFTDVLRRLLAEGVSIRNLRRILMALVEWGRIEDDPLYLTEYVRAALQREIAHRVSRGQGEIIVLLLDPDIETLIRESMQFTKTGSYVDLEPEQLREILNAVEKALIGFPDDAQRPQILTIMEVRSSIRRLIAPLIPWLEVISYQELTPTINIQPIGRISFNGFTSSKVIINGTVGDIEMEYIPGEGWKVEKVL